MKRIVEKNQSKRTLVRQYKPYRPKNMEKAKESAPCESPQ
jgi:hypothetical protein